MACSVATAGVTSAHCSIAMHVFNKTKLCLTMTITINAANIQMIGNETDTHTHIHAHHIRSPFTRHKLSSTAMYTVITQPIRQSLALCGHCLDNKNIMGKCRDQKTSDGCRWWTRAFNLVDGFRQLSWHVGESVISHTTGKQACDSIGMFVCTVNRSDTTLQWSYRRYGCCTQHNRQLSEFIFDIPLHIITGHRRDFLPSQSLSTAQKQLNLTQQNRTLSSKHKDITTQH